MFLFEDLKFYTNEHFRSSSYITEAWDKIESMLLFYLGMLNDINISIIIDSKSIYFTLTSNFKTYTSISKSISSSHCLSLCVDFYTEIDIDIDTNCKDFSCNIMKSNFFYSGKRKDEGVVEFNGNFCFKLKDYCRFKKIIFTNLSREIQYAIHKNIFYLDIEKDYRSEIDAEFESIQAYMLFDKSIEKAKACLTSNNIIQEKNIKIIETLKDLINEE
jgi:hypothetical protein